MGLCVVKSLNQCISQPIKLFKRFQAIKMYFSKMSAVRTGVRAYIEAERLNCECKFLKYVGCGASIRWKIASDFIS